MPGQEQFAGYVLPTPNAAGAAGIAQNPYPTQGNNVQQGSTGGLVNKAGIIQAGVQNGINQTQQINQEMRNQKAYEQEQAGQKGVAGASALPSGGVDPAAAHAGFLSSMGHAIGQFFGGGVPAPAAPAPAAQPAAPMMNGGPVTKPEFMVPGGSGVVTGGVAGIQGFEGGGAIPSQPFPTAPVASQEGSAGGLVNTSGIVQAGVQNGINQAQQIGQEQRNQTAYNQDQAGRSATAGASSLPPATAQQQFTQTVHDLHQDMHDHSLDDNGIPNKDRGIAAPPVDPNAPATPGAPAAAQGAAAAVQSAAANPAAQAGKPEDTPSQSDKPHSISTQQWDQWDANIDKAVTLAAQAGHDPGQVRAALEANRNSFIQGHVLRNLSAANVALLNGDNKGVETALKNAYYYMPDGQNLTVQKQGGQLMYQDPISPMTGDGKPNMIPVDAAHIQMLGQAMLDPMNVQTTIQNVRSAAAKIELEHQQGLAARDTGTGNKLKGTGIYMKAQSDLHRDNSTNYKNYAEGDAARTRASAIDFHLRNLATKMPNMDPEILKAANSASDQFDKQAQGELVTIPTMISDTRPGHEGEMTENPSPNAGKTMRDTSKIPAELKSLTPSQQMEGRAIAGSITLANRGMPPAEAVRLAALYASGKSTPPKNTPKVDGKPMKNVYTDSKTGDTHVWNSAMKKWEVFKLPLQSSQDLATTGSLNVPDPMAAAEVASNGGGQSGGIPSGNPDLDAARNEPDMEPQQFPASS